MQQELNIHPVQAHILKVLMYKHQARFSEMNVTKLPTDHFSFHLKSLIEARLLAKTPNGYELTVSGKELANRFDTENLIIEKQPRITTLICCCRKNGKKTEYLIQLRLKQPYFGYHGFFGGKIKYGETPQKTAQRELFEETGLQSNKLQLVGLKHKMDYQKDGKLLDDKYFFVFKTYDLSGELKEFTEDGKNLWLTEKEIFKLPKLFDGVDETLKIIKQSSFTYSENKYTVSGF